MLSPKNWSKDVMLIVWQRADRFDPALGGPSTWIFTIARNRRIDYLRRARRPLPEDADPMYDAEPAMAADGLVEREENHMSIRAAMRDLPSEQAEVLRLAFFEQKSRRSSICRWARSNRASAWR